jgi:hypothetical protein
LLTLLAYVSLGILADVLIARYYLALSARRALSASVYSLLIPLFTFGVIERAMTTRDWKCVVGFVAGNAIGTYWAVKKTR